MADEQTPPEKVRVNLGDDHYQGEYFLEDPNGKYEIPRRQLERWKTAEDAYRSMQEEIGSLLDKSVTKAAVDKGLWQECPRGCGYRGARESINNHVNRHHREKEGD